MARRKKHPRPLPRAGWRRLKRLRPVTICCWECGAPLDRGDLVYWMPCTLAGRLVQDHPGFYWCQKPECGGKIYHQLEKPEPVHAPNNA